MFVCGLEVGNAIYTSGLISFMLQAAELEFVELKGSSFFFMKVGKNTDTTTFW